MNGKTTGRVPVIILVATAFFCIGFLQSTEKSKAKWFDEGWTASHEEITGQPPDWFPSYPGPRDGIDHKPEIMPCPKCGESYRKIRCIHKPLCVPCNLENIGVVVSKNRRKMLRWRESDRKVKL